MTPQEIKDSQERSAKSTRIAQELTAQTAQFRALFVDWEISKRLKNVGFDVPCFAYYWAIKDTFHYTVKYENHNHFVSRVSAPLIQQVLDWFDQKKVYIDIDHEFGEDWTFCVDNGGNGHSGDEVCYSDRLTATLVAINKALVIIETGTIKTTNYRSGD